MKPKDYYEGRDTNFSAVVVILSILLTTALVIIAAVIKQGRLHG